MSIELVTSLLASTVEFSTPILLAALGEVLTERSGVMNLGIEGIMLIGAFCGFWGALTTGNPWFGILIALIAGALVGVLKAFFSITLKANQVIAGLAIWILGIGLSTYLSRTVLGITPGTIMIPGLEKAPIPLLSNIPFIGKIFFNHNVLVYLTLLLVPILHFILFKTTIGLKIRAVGENPRVADTLGVNVFLIRYLCTIIGAALMGVAGSYLTLGRLFTWVEEVTAGRGWLALAIVFFSKRYPFKALLGAWLFGAAYALQYHLQAMNIGIPYQFLLMLPYIVTIITLLGIIGREEAPAALGIPYSREEPT